MHHHRPALSPREVLVIQLAHHAIQFLEVAEHSAPHELLGIKAREIHAVAPFIFR